MQIKYYSVQHGTNNTAYVSLSDYIDMYNDMKKLPFFNKCDFKTCIEMYFSMNY